MKVSNYLGSDTPISILVQRLLGTSKADHAAFFEPVVRREVSLSQRLDAFFAELEAIGRVRVSPEARDRVHAWALLSS